jgi:hypothetical protein
MDAKRPLSYDEAETDVQQPELHFNIPSSLPPVVLADNVRLPAALLQDHLPEVITDSNLDSNPLREAHIHIGNRFYQGILRIASVHHKTKDKKSSPIPNTSFKHETLVNSTSAEPITTSLTVDTEPTTVEIDPSKIELPVTDETEEPIIITPELPEVEEERRFADENYRSMFGEASYNQKMIGNSVEMNDQQSGAGEDTTLFQFRSD